MNDLTGPTHLNQIDHRPMTMNRTGITNQTRVKITSKPVNHLGELVKGLKELKPVKSKGRLDLGITSRNACVGLTLVLTTGLHVSNI